MTKKETSQIIVKRKIPWWGWTIILLLILGVLENSNNYEDYKSCVENCLTNFNTCSFYAEYQRNIFSYEECSTDLKYCINDCER